MKLFLLLTTILLLQRANSLPSAPKGDPIQAVKGLVSRILSPEWVDKFEYEVIPATNYGFDVFEVDNDTDMDTNKIVLRGNNGVALASAFNFYIKEYCYCSISWGRDGTGDQLNLPEILPIPSTLFRVEFPNRYRYYQNVCTVSYSMVWWNWTRWEREIDWMAMNGLNLILSFTGQEFVWKIFYSSLGLTDDEINNFFAGPAFLAWQRMGNIHGWAGPLDDSWLSEQALLQKKIVDQIRMFGMINVLPGFAGHVPEGLKRIYPNASYTQSAQWGNFGSEYSEDYLLEPTDPLFVKLGKQYYDLLISQYGTDHVYNADTYNEMEPSSTDLDFLRESNAAIYNAMKSSDPNATFLMQGWLFVDGGFWNNDRIRAYLSGVPNDSMIILDLSSEELPIWSKTQSFFGKPFIWCMLHNYGGTRALYGNLPALATEPIKARRTPNVTMVGVGMTPEAIEHNPIIYNFMGEMSWRDEIMEAWPAWLADYAVSRYGEGDENIAKAWKLLFEGAYQFNWSWNIKSLLVRHPNFNLTIDKRFLTFKIAQAWNYMVTHAIADTQPKAGPFLYDLVDIGRQVIVNTFADVYAIYNNAFNVYTNKKDPNIHTAMKDLAESWMKMFDDLDALLGSNVNFLLGTWIDDARSKAIPSSSPSFVNLLEYNARNQITMWGPNENIEDYAAKEWSGLVSDYYAHRWGIFIDAVDTFILADEKFDGTVYNNILYNFEKNWGEKIEAYPTKPTGDTIEISSKLLEKYYRDALYVEANYVSKMDADISSDDLYGGPVNLWANATEQYVVLCEMNPSCVGFSFNYDKDSKMVSFKTKFDGETTVKGRMLVVKG